MYKIETPSGTAGGGPASLFPRLLPTWVGRKWGPEYAGPLERAGEQRWGQQDGSRVSPRSGGAPGAGGALCSPRLPAARRPLRSSGERAQGPLQPGPMGQAGQTGPLQPPRRRGSPHGPDWRCGEQSGGGPHSRAPADRPLRQRSQSCSLSGRAPCCLAASRKASSLASFFWFRASYASLRARTGELCARPGAPGSARPAAQHGPHLFLMMRWTMRSVVRSFPLST